MEESVHAANPFVNRARHNGGRKQDGRTLRFINARETSDMDRAMAEWRVFVSTSIQRQNGIETTFCGVVVVGDRVTLDSLFPTHVHDTDSEFGFSSIYAH